MKKSFTDIEREAIARVWLSQGFNPSKEPQHSFENSEIPPRMCAADMAILFVSGMGAGFVIALLTLGEVVVK